METGRGPRRSRVRAGRSRPFPLDGMLDGGSKSYIEVRVSHTNRTWAVDILNLLIAHAENAMKPRPQYKKILQKFGVYISLAMIIFSTVTVFIFFGALDAEKTKLTMSEYQQIMNGYPETFAGIKSAIAQFGESIKLVLRPTPGAILGLGFLSWFVLSSIWTILPIILSEEDDSSFILSDTDRRRHDARLVRQRRAATIMLATLCGTFVLDVIAHLVADSIARHFFH